jgi:hypothetical protein
MNEALTKGWIMRHCCWGLCLLFVGCQAQTPPAPPATSPATTVTKPIATTTSEPEPDTPFTPEADFKPLSRLDFEAFASEPGTWNDTSEGIGCTGKPRGYLYSKESFQNFTWRLEYRFPRPENLTDETKFKGNTGFMVYITGEHKIWPVSLEVQGKHVQMATIKENGGANAPTVEDQPQVREAARKPVGQWNRLEIISKDGELQVLLNDQAVCKSQPNFLSSGAIGIQAEDFPFEVRRMRIRVDP